MTGTDSPQNVPDRPRKIRLLLVDDHAVMRVGLESVLNAHPAFEVVGGAADAQSAERLHRELNPDVTLLDIQMPDQDGIACLERILQAASGSRIVMLTSSEAEEDIFRALHAGALGYVLKTACPEELLETIRAVHEGRSVLSAAVRARLEEREGSTLLTARELEVLQYVRKGLSNAEIGRFLNVSMHTAKAHVASVLKKLDATDRAEAVGRAFERGILRP